MGTVKNSKRRWIPLGIAVTAVVLANDGRAQESRAIPQAELEKLHRLIKPQAGESRWMEIDWYPSVWEARKKAASEGKPLFIWAGSGGAPAAGC